MNNIICSDSVRDMVLFDDASSKLFATADEEIISLKGELAKWKTLAEGQEWILKDEKEFKKLILDSYEKGVAKNTPAHEILANIIADTYFNI